MFPLSQTHTHTCQNSGYSVWRMYSIWQVKVMYLRENAHYFSETISGFMFFTHRNVGQHILKNKPHPLAQFNTAHWILVDTCPHCMHTNTVVGQFFLTFYQ